MKPLNSKILIWPSSALCQISPDGDILLLIPQHVRLPSDVFIVMTGFGMLFIWSHKMPMLLIHQCISDTTFKDKLIFLSKSSL